MYFDEFKKRYLADGKPRKKPRHIEESIQTACVSWFRIAHPECIIFACPNGGSRNRLEAINMKRSGVLAGVADLIIVADRAVLFVEMKTKKGRQEESQKVFQSNVERLGFEYKICRSLVDFQLSVESWLKNKFAVR